MRLHLDTMNRFHREYRTYTAELRRRHLLNEESDPDKWTRKAIRLLFPVETIKFLRARIRPAVPVCSAIRAPAPSNALPVR